MRPRKHFGAAQGVLEALAENKGKGGGEKFVCQYVEEAHGLLLHGINEPTAVNELRFVLGNRVVKFRQFLRRRGPTSSHLAR